MTQFESLANEVLLDLFEYLDTVDLFRAFVDLTSRFKTLLCKYFRSYHLDFAHISISNFDTLCEKYLRSIIDRIISFNLRNKDETPGLIELFLSRDFHINEMIHLKCLTLNGISSNNKQLLTKLDRLTCLVKLNIHSCDISLTSENDLSIINQIWSLRKLKYCGLDECRSSDSYFNENTFISSTVEHLSIGSIMVPITSNDLFYLFSYTPQLKVLSIKVKLTNEYKNIPIIKTSITTLNLMFMGEINLLNKLLQNLPSLLSLTIDSCEFNGDQWEEIIVKNIPKLKVFRFQRFVSLRSINNTEEYIDQLLDTFRTPFWLHERQWYVRCDWEPRLRITRNYGHLYTLPYVFDSYADHSEGFKRSKWTCSDDTKYWSFNRTHTFDCRNSKNTYSFFYPACFLNIHKLKSHLPISETLWSIIPTLDHLTSLHLDIFAEDCQSKLQSILDQSPRLYSLTIEFTIKTPNIKQLFQLVSPSIRRLRINPYAKHPHFDFDQQKCNQFLTSPLVFQCEVLEMRIRSPEIIEDILNSMKNLRSMIIHLTDDAYRSPRLTQPELVQWAQNHLSSECWISVCNYSPIAQLLKIWIS